MHVAPNEKYAAFFMSRCAVGADIPEEQEVAPRVWVSRRFGVQVEDHWRQWLGSLVIDEMEEGGFVMYVTAPSEHPEVLDGVNQALEQQANDILNGLLLQGIPRFEKGLIVNGANVSGQIGIRHYSPFEQLHRLPIARRQSDFIVSSAEVARCLSLAPLIRYIQASSPEWARVLRGVRTLLKANYETNAVGDRLHQLVRAVEGVIKPRTGQSRNDFAHRGQTLAVASQPNRDILLELYDLRSAVEHLNVPTDALPAGGTEAQTRDLVNRRTRQAEALARFALLRVLESAVMFSIFRTDADIDAFWALHDHERLPLWGTRLDLAAIL